MGRKLTQRSTKSLQNTPAYSFGTLATVVSVDIFTIRNP